MYVFSSIKSVANTIIFIYPMFALFGSNSDIRVLDHNISYNKRMGGGWFGIQVIKVIIFFFSKLINVYILKTCWSYRLTVESFSGNNYFCNAWLIIWKKIYIYTYMYIIIILLRLKLIFVVLFTIHTLIDISYK